MSRYTVFVGGVHGSGKGVFSRLLREEIICDYISASALLHWATLDKTVKNVDANQQLLASLLPEALRADKVFLIDGHFALWNKDYAVERVSPSVFEACQPDVIVCIVCKPEVIAARLKERDGIDYSPKEIDQLQSNEVSQAKMIADKLCKPFYIIDSTDENGIKNIIQEIKKNMTEYTRDNIYSEMLKTVIIRFDFSGSTSIRRFVDEIKPDMKKNFNQMRPIKQNQYTFKVRSKELEDGSLPVAEQQNSILYHFYDCEMDEDLDVVLDIAIDSVCLTIDCRKKYNGSKKYTDLMVELIMRLVRFDPYINIERIGVRKIDAQVIPEGESFSDYFNENYLAAQSWHASRKEKVNFTELYKMGRVNFNVVQHIDRLATNETRAIFDVDAYIVNGDICALMEDETELARFLNKEVQDKMFELFVAFASKDYLEKSKQAKANQ